MLPCRVHIYVYQWLRYVPCRLTSPTASAMISQVIVPLVILLLFYASRQYIAYRRIVRTIKYVSLFLLLLTLRCTSYSPGCSDWPGFRTLLNNRQLFFPFSVRGISPGFRWLLYSKHADFARAGWDVVAAVRHIRCRERRRCSSCWSTVATSL